MASLSRRTVRHRAGAEEADFEGSWAVSYGDMITLLLTFFILFFNIGKKSESGRGIDAAILAEFGAETTRSIASTPAAARLPGVSESAGSEIAAIPGAVTGPSPKAGVDPEVLKKFDGLVYSSGARLIVEFTGTSFFDRGSTTVTPTGAAALERFVHRYLPFAGATTLGIRGFTDETPVHAGANRKFSDNLELSTLRALAAMRVIQRAGVPLSRMRISGLGELTAPLRTPASSKDQPLSRRVVLTIEPNVKE